MVRSDTTQLVMSQLLGVRPWQVRGVLPMYRPNERRLLMGPSVESVVTTATTTNTTTATDTISHPIYNSPYELLLPLLSLSVQVFPFTKRKLQ
jgi:hypothetical protein